MSIIIGLLIGCCESSIVYLVPFLQPSRSPLPVRSNLTKTLIERGALVINLLISIFLLVPSAMLVKLQSLTSVLVICGGMVFVGFFLIILSKDGNKIVTEVPSIYLGKSFAISNLLSRIGAILVLYDSFSICAKIVTIDKIVVLPWVTLNDITVDILMLMAYATIVGIVTVIIRKRDAKITVVSTSTNETSGDK
jgi:hypothetical protein